MNEGRDFRTASSLTIPYLNFFVRFNGFKNQHFTISFKTVPLSLKGTDPNKILSDKSYLLPDAYLPYAVTIGFIVAKLILFDCCFIIVAYFRISLLNTVFAVVGERLCFDSSMIE